jgi:hypothetical protein
MLIFKSRKIHKKKLPFFYWTGCKGTPFSFEKEKGKGWNIKQRQGRGKHGNKVLRL